MIKELLICKINKKYFFDTEKYFNFSENTFFIFNLN